MSDTSKGLNKYLCIYLYIHVHGLETGNNGCYIVVSILLSIKY